MTDDKLERVARAIGEALAGKDLTDEALTDAAEDAIEAMQGWRPISTYDFKNNPWALGMHYSETPELPGIVKPIHAPYVCQYMPEDDNYVDCWNKKDEYGDIEENCATPTHWQPLQHPPKKG